jgi:hypothetical protein
MTPAALSGVHLQKFPQFAESLLSIDASRSLALPFSRMLHSRLPHHLPQAVTPNTSEEIHVH